MFASLIFVFAVLPLSFATEYIGTQYIASPLFAHDRYGCTLPPHPEHGRYSFSLPIGFTSHLHIFPIPGGRYVEVNLNISCDSGYISSNIIESISCIDGHWSPTTPICIPDVLESTRRHYQHERISSNLQELPWHAFIYKKSSDGYNDMCGGTLISTTKVISSATCFHDYKNKLRPASDFVVAVNKMYYKYNDSREWNSQYSDVIDIKVHGRYWGRNKSYKFEDNIAIAVVNTPFFLYQYVRPIVLDFDKDLNNTQLTEGNSGKTIRWRWSEADGEFKGAHAADTQFIKREDCENMLPIYRQPYLTRDKFCMRYDNVIGPLSPDMGNGVFFFDPTSQRYYLRGLSTDLEIAQDGNTVIIMYTSIGKHERFILEHL